MLAVKFHKMLLVNLGGIQQLRGQNFAIFDPPLHGQFLYPEGGQKQTFFDTLPLILSTYLLYGP